MRAEYGAREARRRGGLACFTLPRAWLVLVRAHGCLLVLPRYGRRERDDERREARAMSGEGRSFETILDINSIP